MNPLRFIALESDLVDALRKGSPDANGQMPEPQVSDGNGNLCRHCLGEIAKDDPFLVLAHRPFPALQPYAEVGPLFIHAEDCPRYAETGRMPALFAGSKALLIRGYGSDDRIVYGTGQVVPPREVKSSAAKILENPKIAYVHVRSASNNCYQCRIERG